MQLAWNTVQLPRQMTSQLLVQLTVLSSPTVSAHCESAPQVTVE